MSVTADQMRIIQLKDQLETEIVGLKMDIVEIDKLIKGREVHAGHFATELRKRRSQQQERLTQCMVTYDQCWPNPWWVLKTLEDFYREAPLY